MSSADRLFPACAGVIPAKSPLTGANAAFPRVCGVIPGEERGLVRLAAFPRVCGGDPVCDITALEHKRFSPRVRG